MSAAVAEEADVLEEDVFPEEAVSCFLSPLNTESVDFPDTPVSSRLQCFVSLQTLCTFLSLSSTLHLVLQYLYFHDENGEGSMA